MDSQTKNKIIVEELNKYYQLAKYVPSELIWAEFLATLDEPTKQKLSAQYTYEQAFATLWIYKHWYMQNYHKEEVDEIMQMVLMPEVFKHYQNKYRRKLSS